MPIVKIKTNDNQLFEIDYKILKFSNYVRNFTHMTSELPNDLDKVLHLAEADGPTMQKIIEWGVHHKDEEVTVNGQYPMQEWDATFFNGLSNEEINKFQKAAKVLDICRLTDLLYDLIEDRLVDLQNYILHELFGEVN